MRRGDTWVSRGENGRIRLQVGRFLLHLLEGDGGREWLRMLRRRFKLHAQ